jgi:hypothetical protein
MKHPVSYTPQKPFPTLPDPYQFPMPDAMQPGEAKCFFPDAIFQG